MILTCPTCTTRYLLDPAKLGADGRLVRCGKCNHIWHQAPPREVPPHIDPIPASIEPRPIPPGSNLPAFRPQPKKRRSAVGWVLLVALVAAMIGGAILARAQIVALWPPAVKIYRLFEAEAIQPGDGLELRNITSRRTAENGIQILVVEGEVANVSKKVQAVPPLIGALRDHERHDVQRWTFSTSEPKLLPGEVAKFSSTLTNPSDDAADVSVDFAPAGAK